MGGQNIQNIQNIQWDFGSPTESEIFKRISKIVHLLYLGEKKLSQKNKNNKKKHTHRQNSVENKIFGTDFELLYLYVGRK